MFDLITITQFNYSSLAVFILAGASFLIGYLIGRKQLNKEISDRKRTEATLQENSQLFRNLVEASSDWVWEIDENAIYTYISPKVRDLLGYEPDEVLGKSVFEFMPQTEARRVAEFFASVASQQLPIQYLENTNCHKDGRLVVLETSAVPIFDAKGKFCGYRGIDRDITKRQQTETALQESEAINRAILDALPDLIFRCLVDGTIVDFKPAKDIPLYLSPNEFLGKNTLDILPSEPAQINLQAIARAISTGETQAIEYQLVVAEELHHYEARIVAIGKEQVLSFVRDISQRKQTEQLLRESQERLNNILNSLSDVVWSLSLKTHQYVYINTAVETIYDRPHSEFLENSNLWLLAIHSEDRERVETLTHLAIERGINKDIEYRIVRPDGEIRWIRDRAQPICDEMGTPIRIDGIATDITEYKQAREALQQVEARNCAIIDAIPDLMLRVRQDGFCLDFIYPKAKDAGVFVPIEQHLSEVLPPGLVQKQLQAIAQALATSELQVYEQQLTKYGKPCYEEVRISPINEEEVLVLVRDISDRKQAEIALQDSEERLKSIINTISDGLIVVDRHGKIRFANPAVVALFGRSSAEMLDFIFGTPFVGSKVTEICINHSSGEALVAQMQVTEIVWEHETAHLVSLRNITESYQAKQALQESEAKYRRIVETATEGIWVLDRDSNTSFVNPQMARMLGYSVEEMIGKSFFDFLDEEEKVNLKTFIGHYRPGAQQERDIKFRCQDGEVLWAISSTNPFGDRDGEYAGSLSMITDITERKRVEQALYESEQKLQGILASVQDVVWSASAKTLKTIYMNLAAEKVFGRPAWEFYSDPVLWFKIIHPEDKKLIKQQLKCLHEAGTMETEYRIVRPDGEVRWLYNRSQVVYDSTGQAIRVDGTDTDVTERKLAQARLQYNAFYDPLTDLPNRALFMDRLDHALQRNKRHPECLFAVLFLDLDGFKLINDSLGHLVGDRLLQAFASRLSEFIRPCDTLARLGGDEFTILLEDIKNVNDAILVAERILQTIALPFTLDSQQVFTNTSIGIALSDSNYQLSSEILRDADTAMYEAKAQGKGCFVVFDPRMYHLALSRLQLETDLRRAIAQKQFQIFYQPIVSLETNLVTEFEALIRWQHPEKGLISPAEFIPIAEETGLIVPIGQWILSEACQQMRAWQEQFSEIIALKISINLSSKQLKSINFLQQIDAILAQTGLDPTNLKLEITESLLIENIAVAADLFLELKKRKIELCLDDFGTGYSSLSYLHRFPIDTLKIDRSFVMQMKPEDESIEIVRAIVVLAHILGMNVIAEGIETEAQLKQLKKLSCQQGQGYLFAKPLSKDEAEAMIKTLGSRLGKKSS